MINPSFQVQDELYIHAASEAVWQKFSRSMDWPRWNSEVLSAAWVQGEAWQEGSIFKHTPQEPDGHEEDDARNRAYVRAGQHSRLGEQRRRHHRGQQRVIRRRGRRLQADARHTYHGMPTLALRLIERSSAEQSKNAMRELKEFVEGISEVVRRRQIALASIRNRSLRR
jgi:hypothetical protein